MTQPYVYRLDHPTTGEFYIGYRSANKVPAHEDLGHMYFTSSKRVKDRFHEFKVTMVLKCDDAQEAYDLEQFLIWTDWEKPGMLNKHCNYGKGNWHATGQIRSEETRAKMSASHKGRKPSDESRAKMSAAKKDKLSGHKGKKHTEETKKKMSAAKKGKPKPKFACMLHNRKEYDKANFDKHFLVLNK
jgi:hypothetical protein